uniref:Transmembrane protein 186 n=1 Tax=Lygus hesperus TaxID=30085 RepID=A0A0A9W6T4_LYGHE
MLSSASVSAVKILSTVSARCAVKNTDTLIPFVISRQVHKKKVEKVIPVGSSFSTVYRLPQISMCSLVNKFKKYQLFAFGAGTPVVFGLHALELCDHSIPVTFTCVGIATTVAIFSIGQIFTNLVGVVYISKDRSRVKISYLDFWGDRRDKIVDSSDVVGITKESLTPWDTLNIHGDSANYKISFRLGEILMTPLFKVALKHDPDTHTPVKT